MSLQEEVTKMRKDFKSKTSTLRKQIDNKKQKIEQEQKTLRNHQKKYDEQLEEHKNIIITLQTLKVVHVILNNNPLDHTELS